MSLFNVARVPNPSITRQRLDILRVIIGGLDMKASDPRDKIFALLVFGEETHRIADLPDLIRPTYTKSLPQVYIDFTLWWARHYGSLKILSAVQTLRGRSWLDLSVHDPSNNSKYDFESQVRPSWTLWADGQSEWIYSTLALGDDTVNYNACGDQPIDVDTLDTSSINPCALPVKGIRLGAITSLNYFDYDRSKYSSEMFRVFHRIFDPQGARNLWKNTWKGFNPSQPPSTVDNDSDTYWHIREHHSQVMAANPDVPKSAINWIPCLGKCLFRTEGGHVGLCPSGTQPGDILTILYGGSVPYLLREKAAGSNEFYLVGEAYVEEIMFGQAFEAGPMLSAEEIFHLI